MAFKQKSGSPFQRNFGVGSSPAKQTSPMKDTRGKDSYGGPLTKDKDGNLTVASKRIKELREKHNASTATKDHHGDPHGPKPSPLEMKSPMKNYKNPQDYKVFNMGNKPTPMEMHGEEHDGPKMYDSPTDMKETGKTATYMKSPLEHEAKFMKDSKNKHTIRDHNKKHADGRTHPSGSYKWDTDKSSAAKMKSPLETGKKTYYNTVWGKKGEDKSPNEMKSSGFKMRNGSPMKRNFGIGESPMKIVPSFSTSFVDKHDKEIDKEDIAGKYEEVMNKASFNKQGESYKDQYPTVDAWVLAGMPGGNQANTKFPSVSTSGKVYEGRDRTDSGEAKVVPYHSALADAKSDMENNVPVDILERFEGQDLASAAGDLFKDGKISEADFKKYMSFSEDQIKNKPESAMTEEEWMSSENDDKVGYRAGGEPENIENTKKMVENYLSKNPDSNMTVDSYLEKIKGGGDEARQLLKNLAEQAEDTK